MRYTIIAFALFLFASGLAHAQSEYLDKTFGDKGVVTVKSGPDVGTFPDDIHILPDGKIIHVGRIQAYSSYNAYLYMMRHHSDGRRDSSFGVNGRIIFYNILYAGVTKLYCYPDGRLLTYGLKWDYSITNRIPSIIRFFANGMIDTTFGNKGVYESPESGGFFAEMNVNTDGTIVAIGARHKAGSSSGILTPSITHLTPSGKGDPLFGDEGVNTAGSEADAGAAFVAVMFAGDKCIFSAYADDALKPSSTMFCTDLSGKIDSSFGTNGRVMLNVSDGNEGIQEIIAAPDRKFLCTVMLENDTGISGTALLRFLPTGELDHTFGTFGSAPEPDDDYTRFNFMTSIDSNRNIMQWGKLCDSTTQYMPVVLHYLPDGRIDTARCENGTSKELLKYMSIITSIATDYDGKFVVAGYRTGSATSDVVICRINNLEKQQVVTASNGSPRVSIYPTPSTNNCTITYTLPNNSNCTMTLRDESGREVRVFARDAHRTAGKHEEELDLRGLAAGVYFLQIESNGTVQTAKLIKQ